MRKILFIAILFIGVLGHSQRFQDGHVDVPMTTAEMNAIVSPEEGQTISNSTTNSKWVYLNGSWRESGGGPSQLSDLTDVNTSTPTNRNVLIADGVDFESRPLLEADISDFGSYVDVSSTQSITGQKTFVNGNYTYLPGPFGFSITNTTEFPSPNNGAIGIWAENGIWALYTPAGLDGISSDKIRFPAANNLLGSGGTLDIEVAEFLGKVAGQPPTADDHFVTRGYADANYGGGISTENQERINNVRVLKWNDITTNTTFTADNFTPPLTPDRGKSIIYTTTANDTITIPELTLGSLIPISIEAPQNGSAVLRSGPTSYFKIAGETGFKHEFSFSNWETLSVLPQNDTIYKVVGNGTVGTYDPIAPTVPTSLTNDDQGSLRLDYSFTASTDNIGVTGYEYDLDNSGSPVDIGNTTSFTVSSLTPGTSYNVKVRAYDAAGNFSAYTANVGGTTVADSYPTGNFASTDDANAFGDWADTGTTLVLASDYPGDSFMYRALNRNNTSFYSDHKADLTGVFDGTSTYTVTIVANQRQGTNGRIDLRILGTSSTLPGVTGDAFWNLPDTAGWNSQSWTVDSSLAGTDMRIRATISAAIASNEDEVLDPGEEAIDIAVITITKN